MSTIAEKPADVKVEIITPSKYQRAIYEFVEKEKRSAVVIAVAGSGKTTTIVEASKLIDPSLQVSFVAFNRAIANELKTKVPYFVKASTLNGMGYGALLNHLGTRGLKLDDKKTNWIMNDLLTSGEYGLYGAGLRKLVALAKAHGIVPRRAKGTGLMLDTEQNWADLIDKYDVEFEKDAQPERAIELARDVLAESIREAKHTIDFNDQLYLPVIWQANFQQQDLIFVDEAQDVNAVQRAMLRMALKPSGRLIAVGDPCQAIYGFRGADTEAIANIKKEFDAVELPLSVSYRCPRAVVAEAQKYVSHIESHELAPEGKVETIGNFDATLFEATDGIVCRNTAPLIDMAYKLLRQNKACRVLGREIGQGLITLIKKMDAATVDELEDKLETYLERERRKLITKGKEEQAAGLQDKFETIMIFVSQLPETDRTMNRLIANIENLFTDNNQGRLTLCTVHKAKGLEWPRVFILNRELMPCKWARQDWQKVQETNIIYVAVTRAKEELYYIDSKRWKVPGQREEKVTEEKKDYVALNRAAGLPISSEATTRLSSNKPN